MSGPWLYITVDHGRQIALLRGPGTADVRRLFDGVGGVYAEMTFVYSAAGRGWVIPARFVPDVEAYAQSRHELVVVHDRKEAAA